MEKGLVAEAGTYLRSFVEHTRGRYMLGLLVKAGCLEAALGWLQPYVERRDSAAVDGAVYVLSRLERPRNAINLVREFGDLDDPNLQSGLARFYEAVGETQNMLDCYRAAAESGDVYRTRRFADELERAGRLDDALLWYQRAVEAGGRKEWSTLPSGVAVLILDPPDNDVTSTSVDHRTAAEMGNGRAMVRLGAALAADGDVAEAERWLRRAVLVKAPMATSTLAELLLVSGRSDDAAQAVDEAIDGGMHLHRRFLRLLVEHDAADFAARWLRSRAETGDADAMYLYATACDHAAAPAQEESARYWIGRAAQLGHVGALRHRMEELETSGSLNEAADAARAAMRHGEVGLQSRLVGMLKRAGRTSEAEDQLRAGLEDRRIRGSVRDLASFLDEAGRSDEATDVLSYGIQPGGRTARPWRAPLPEPGS